MLDGHNYGGITLSLTLTLTLTLALTIILKAQSQEKEALHYENANATAKNSGYESGRLARAEAIQSMKAESEQRLQA
jgi:hypothetical protein